MRTKMTRNNCYCRLFEQGTAHRYFGVQIIYRTSVRPEILIVISHTQDQHYEDLLAFATKDPESEIYHSIIESELGICIRVKG